MQAPSADVPVVDGFSVLSREYLEDPVAYMYGARERASIFYVPELAAWVPTRYVDIDRILKDFETFSSVSAQIPPLTPGLRQLVAEDDERIVRRLFEKQLVLSDPPGHTIPRKTAQATFSRKRIEKTREQIAQICDVLIDEFADRGHGNLMDLFARRFSLRVMGAMLGLDPNDLGRFEEMVTAFFSLMVPAGVDASYMHMPDEQVAGSFQGLMRGYRYFAAFVDERRESPRDDMATAMIELRDEDGSQVMDTADVLAHMIGIVAAGTDTTSNLIAAMVVRLTREPAISAAAVADRSLWPAVVEEALRRESPGDKAMRRVTHDTEIDGQPIPEGSMLLLLNPAANGDPEMFPDPLKFDYQRTEIARSRAFGIGRHFCLGAPIVRPEATIAMEALYGRLADLRADLTAESEFAPLLMRVRTSLPVTWTVST